MSEANPPLVVSPDTERARRVPPAEVERMAPGFTVVHSVLMRHGVREVLFERMAD